MKCLQKEQVFNEVQIEWYVAGIIAGIEPEYPKKRYLNVAKRIKRFVQAFDPDIDKNCPHYFPLTIKSSRFSRWNILKLE